MVDNVLLAKVLKDAMKGGKSVVGAKETIAHMKGSKAILCTTSLPPAMGSKLREEAKKHGVPVIDLAQTSAELARMIGRPYKVSAMTLKSVSEGEIKQLMR